MTYGVIFTLSLTTGIFVLFASEVIAIEATCLITVVILMTVAHFTADYGTWMLPEAATLLKGFASPALASIVALLVLAEGINQSGAFDKLGEFALKRLGNSPRFAFAGVLLVVLVVSALVNNTPAVIIFIPIMASLASKFNFPNSKVMMNLSFVSVFGGMLTLIGSSTNLLVVGSLVALGAPSPGFFGFTLAGSLMTISGLVFIFFIMPKIMPDRPNASRGSDKSGRPFLAQLNPTKSSNLLGAKPRSGVFMELAGVTIKSIYRRKKVFFPPFESIKLEAKDKIIIATSKGELESLVKSHHFDIVTSDFDFENLDPDDDLLLAEMIILPRSRLIGRTLAQARFFDSYGCRVIGLSLSPRHKKSPLADIPLDAGDTLIVVAPSKRIVNMRHHPDVLPVEWTQQHIPDPIAMRKSLIISGAVLLCMVTGLLPHFVATIAGALAMIMTRALRIEQAFRAIDREIVLLIAVSLALGATFESTGTASFIVDSVFSMAKDLSQHILLGLFFLAVVITANLVTAKPAALLYTPVAVELSARIDIPIEALAIAIILGANCAFASPVGNPTNFLVMGPGNYRFVDFVKVGIPLIIWATITFMLIAKFMPFPQWQ